jgi:L-fucose isomerase-like protein
MKYYIYFDRYRRPKKAVSEKDLVEKYSNDPQRFLEAMGEQHGVNGHVGMLSFESEKELTEYFEKTGEEIIGFYECREESRPYNF